MVPERLFTEKSSVINQVYISGDLEKGQEIVRVLMEVYDPEIPVVNLVELGMIYSVQVDGVRIHVGLLPTFVGCPAIKLIQHRISEATLKYDANVELHVHMVFDPPWTTERIMESARDKLRAYGIAPPMCTLYQSVFHSECPYCGSLDTKIESLFGPTACRSLFYCHACRQPFEALKPV